MVDGEGSDTGYSLAFGNLDVSLPDVHISLLECQHLTDTHAGVKQDKYSINTGIINVCPEPVNFLPTKWVVRMHGFIFSYR